MLHAGGDKAAKSSRLQILIELLHSRDDAALATHSAAMPGYPLATEVSFTTDQHHCPVMLMSQLAEHTRNLSADRRASFLIATVLAEGEIARISLVGEVQRVDADAGLVDRYLRFHPEAERFLQLGDFHFHRFQPERALVVGGFGKAAWIDGERLVEAASIPLDVEVRLLDEANARTPEGMTLLGCDPYGTDVSVHGVRRRLSFSAGPVTADAMLATIESELAK